MSAGDKVLVPQTGHFSTGWAEMAESFGIDCEILPNDLRVATDPAKIAACLDADKSHKIKAVMQVHTDTSTGVTHDIKAIHEAIAATGHPALYMVDSVAALGTCAFEMDAWGIDVAVTASQKGLMCPPGLGIVAASARALEAHKTSTAPRRYWDWSQRRHTAHYRAFGGTCPEHLIFALDEALRMIEEEGLEAIYRRHFHLAEAVRRAVDVWAEGGALEIHALHPAERSNGVTAIRTAEGIDPVELRLLVRQMMRTSVAGGLGQLRGRAFRIGHLGDLNEPMILGSLAAVETSLEMLDIAHQKGGVTAAIDYIAGIKKTELAAARAALREKAA
jgi:alanine-glyoxylate transaminase/serine-glyoxylate transaminase/serine-pyruvate transaminase